MLHNWQLIHLALFEFDPWLVVLQWVHFEESVHPLVLREHPLGWYCMMNLHIARAVLFDVIVAAAVVASVFVACTLTGFEMSLRGVVGDALECFHIHYGHLNE